MSVAGVAFSPRYLELLEKRFEPRQALTDGPPLIDAARHLELASVLRDDYGFKIFGFVVAVHYPATKDAEPGTDLIRISYGLRTVGKNTEQALWQLEAPIGQSVPSLAHLFAGADWQEREQYDLVGIGFANHPDLRRLMLPEDWDGHPLRKDYAIDTRVPPWR